MGCPTKVTWAKMICQSSAPPKCVFITWLMLHGKLVTCDYLQKIGIHVDKRCCLCDKEDETLDHLFFECDVAHDIWRGIREWVGIQRQLSKWQEEKEFLLTQCTTNSGKHRFYRYSVTMLVYHIWRERNQRRMQHKRSSVDCIMQQYKVLIAWCSVRDRKLVRFVRWVYLAESVESCGNHLW